MIGLSLPLWLALVLCAFTGGYLSILAVRRWGVNDTPNARSSHSDQTLTGGGVSIIAVLFIMVAGVVVFGDTALGNGRHYALLGLAMIIAALGLYDDRRGVSAKVKLLIMVIVAAVTVQIHGPVTVLDVNQTSVSLPYGVGFVGTMLWIIVVVNAVNFVDGANGMLVGTMGVATLGLLILALVLGSPSLGLWPLSLLVGLLAFAPFNLRASRRMFAGDIGALSAGFVFAVGGLWLARGHISEGVIFVLPLLILPILIDVFMTLIRRARAGENLLQAHNQHLFQRQIQAGASHMRVSTGYMIAHSFCAVLAVALVLWGGYYPVIGTALAIVAGVAIYTVLYRRAVAKRPS